MVKSIKIFAGYLLFLELFLSVCVVAQSEINTNKTHIGAWELVSYKYGDAKKAKNLPKNMRRIKFLTDNRFSWVQYNVKNGKTQFSSGGTYTLIGDSYIETTEYYGKGILEFFGKGLAKFFKKKHKFTIRVENDKLYQTGHFYDGLKLKETWQRMK